MPANTMRVKGIKRYFEPKAGRYYCYHRATGRRISEEFGSPAFLNRLLELDQEAEKKAGELARLGTLHALMLAYKQSDEYRDLSPRTRSDYEKVFVFLKPLWPADLSAFTVPQLNGLRTEWRKMRGRRFVNYIRSVLSILFAYGKALGVMSGNPARDMMTVKRPRGAPKVNRPWSIAERRAVIEHLPPHLRLPVVIGLYTGMREGDVLTVRRDVVSGNRISIVTAKRLVAIDLHVLPDLRQALLEAPRHDAPTLCANSRGSPWTASGFRASLRKELKKLEKAGLIQSGITFHGTRHSVATDLAEAGVSAEDIAAVLGQRSSKMAEHYSREADRRHRSRAAIHKLNPLRNSRENSGDDVE